MTTAVQSQPVHSVAVMGRSKRTRPDCTWRPEMVSEDCEIVEELSPRKRAMIVNTSKIFLELQERVKARIQEIRQKDEMEREESRKIATMHPIQWAAETLDTPVSPAMSANPASPDTAADLMSSGVTPALAPVKIGTIEAAEKGEKAKQLKFASGEMGKDSTVPPMLIPDISI